MLKRSCDEETYVPGQSHDMQTGERQLEIEVPLTYTKNVFANSQAKTYNHRIISLGQSSRPYKNTSTPYIASFSALPFPHRSMLTTKLSWAKPNIVPQYTTLSGGGEGGGCGA
jgi:hypothetical protein